ncbi:hypothetical protein DUPY_23940 [Duganella phyllosphaerae]|uniref:Lipoprotein n=2 Tax=Duganella phyllosphaerae TaxID=762836 RepID=A0A1E7WNK9_9BURK|nr:hypothetical protein DUPY_23940 [Duganella phyllosphaerae]
MFVQRLRQLIPSTLLVVAFASVLTGCAMTQPRTLEEDRNVKKVAIVSLLEEKTPVAHFGLTVFNNDYKIVDQKGELNRTALRVVEERLHAARPQWSIVAVPTDAALAAKLNDGIPWVSFTNRVKPELLAIARDTGADLVFVMLDTTSDNTQARGMGIRTRTMNKDNVGNAMVHARIMLALLDKNGEEIRRAGGPDGSVPAAEIGLNYDLSSLQDPAVEQRAAAAIRKQLEATLIEATTSMGY